MVSLADDEEGRRQAVRLLSGAGSRAGRLAAFAVALFGFAALVAPAEAAPLSAVCAVPEPLLGLPGILPDIASRVTNGEGVRILAIGSSSTEGVGASTPQNAYPPRLELELERRFQGVDFQVDNAGRGGEVAGATVERMRRLVEANKPDLVIWQVGTNDAIRKVDRQAFEEIVTSGLAFLHERDVDVILMDPQYFPGGESQEGYRALVEGLSSLAKSQGVAVLQRYAAMRYWAELPEGQRQAMLSADSFHLNDLGYACTAEILAESIHRRVAGGALREAGTARGAVGQLDLMSTAGPN